MEENLTPNNTTISNEGGIELDLRDELVRKVIELEKELAHLQEENKFIATKNKELINGIICISREERDLNHSAFTSCNIIRGICKGLVDGKE